MTIHPAPSSKVETGPSGQAGGLFLAALRLPRLPVDLQQPGQARALGHLPLLFWVVSVLRPRLTVLAGLGAGELFVGLAQALETSDRPAALLGLDAAEGAGMAPELRALHARDHAGLARIAPPDHPASAVDLLVLDLSDEALATTVADLWLPHLTAGGGVVVLGDAAQIAAASARIGDRIEGLAFDFGEPVDAAACRLVVRAEVAGADAPEGGTLLAALQDLPMARQVFHRLGRGLIAEQALQHLPQTRAEVTQLSAEKTGLETRLAAALAEIEDLRQAESRMTRQQAEQVTRLYELELSYREATEAQARLQADLAQLRVAHAERIEDIARITEHFQTRAEKLRQDLTACQDRAATQLATQLAKAEERAKAHRIRIKDDLRKEARLELRQERAKREAMLRSLSWRVTRPLRGLRRLFGRR